MNTRILETTARTRSNAIHGMKQAGLSLVESLLVLAVIALILIGAYQGYKAATGEVKGNNMIKSTVVLSGNITRLYSQSGNYTGLNNSVMADSALVPDGLRVDLATDNITNAWGGAVTIGPGQATTGGVTAPGGTASNTFYHVAYTGVEAVDCANFVNGISGSAVAVGVLNGGTSTTVKPLGGVSTPALIATACAGTDTKAVLFVGN